MVNGPHYAEIINGKNLEADNLPPPIYILEAYAAALECLNTNSPGSVANLVQRGETLQSEFKTRSSYWESHLPDDFLIEQFLDESRTAAIEFFNVQNTDFNPALAAGDRAEAQKIFSESMQPLYEKHRHAILKLVDCTNRLTAHEERDASKTISAETRFLISGLVVQTLFVIALFRVLSNGAAAPRPKAA